MGKNNRLLFGDRERNSRFLCGNLGENNRRLHKRDRRNRIFFRERLGKDNRVLYRNRKRPFELRRFSAGKDSAAFRLDWATVRRHQGHVAECRFRVQGGRNHWGLQKNRERNFWLGFDSYRKNSAGSGLDSGRSRKPDERLGGQNRECQKRCFRVLDNTTGKPIQLRIKTATNTHGRGGFKILREREHFASGAHTA